MIEQLLNREFVLEQLRAVREELEKGLERRRKDFPPIAATLTDEDWRVAAANVADAEKCEKSTSSGQEGFNPPASERRGRNVPPLDDYAFISRDPVISLLQSALEEYFETCTPEALRREPFPGDRRGGKPRGSSVTDISLKGAALRRGGPSGRRLFDQFSELDIRWVASVVAMGIRKFHGRREFNSKPADPVVINDKTRLILVADWGTGVPRAQKVAKEMRKILLEGKREGVEQHVIHLGDVYYSGWEGEYKKRFLPYWPVEVGEEGDLFSWSLNGNHDMYSGGFGYYDCLLKDARFKRQQQSSFFSMSNRYWQILGLDTAWDDFGLKDPQAEWLKSQMSVKNKKTILLSHHPLFSAYEKGGSKTFEEKIISALDSNWVQAWFWGHEHRCVHYKPFLNVKYGRCIGYGGTPVYMWHKEGDPYPEPAFYEYRSFLQSGIERWALFGFAVLDFAGSEVKVRYINEGGKEHKREDIA